MLPKCVFWLHIFYPNRIWKAPCWQSALEIGWSSLDLNLKTGWLANEGKDETITILWLQWEECQQISRYLCLSWLNNADVCVSRAPVRSLCSRDSELSPSHCPRCTGGQEGFSVGWVPTALLSMDLSYPVNHGYFPIDPHILSTLSHWFLRVDIYIHVCIVDRSAYD